MATATKQASKATKAKASKNGKAVQPRVEAGMYVDCTVDGTGPHYGMVMEAADWGVLVRIDSDDAEYGGRPVVVPIEDVNIIPAQAMSK